MSGKALAGLLTVLGMLVAAQSAHALTEAPVWKCRASPAYTSVAANPRVEPEVANGNVNTAQGADPDYAQCAQAEVGGGSTPSQVGISQDDLAARSATARTTITPELGRAVEQSVVATTRVEELTLKIPTGGTTVLGVRSAISTATGTCVDGTTTPLLDGSSEVAGITLGGQDTPLDELAQAIADLIGDNPIVTIRVNERIESATSLTVRALHVVVLPAAGGAPLVDFVAAESKVATNGPVCDPSQQGDGPALGQVCPPGSRLDIARNLCVIPAGTAGSRLGTIVIGRPFQGPSGGTVLPIDVARRRYGRGSSPCLKFTGAPRYAIIGTNRADRMTGTNGADRIIGLGGNDRIDGGRGNDCIEGRKGNDTLSGGLGNDRIYGSVGNDHLNGGSGTDRLSAGSGNDTINAAFGRDRTFGGSGRDYINIATAGPPASASCGSGPDKVRINANERRRVRGCEVVYVFRDR